MRSFLFAAVGVALLFSLPGCGGGSPLTLTQANLERVKEGMSPAEVKGVLGNPTDSKSEPIPIVGGSKTTYTYRNEEARAVIVFKNDTVQTKEGYFAETDRKP